ncbi:MAG: exo-alpha-sialidase [Thaumarchaeota archaeon]|nr:exo-alpha-sialidase [Nitrososphaerota archaeon]
MPLIDSTAMKLGTILILSVVMLSGIGSSFAQVQSPGFTNPVTLSDSSANSELPHILVSGDGIFAIWSTTHNGKSDVYFAKSTDGGTSFGKPVLISDNAKLSAFPQMAIDGNNVYSLWVEKSEDNSTNIVFTKSTDQGNSFAPPVYITHGVRNSGIPKIFADTGKVYLTWEDNNKGNFEVFLSKSSNSGDSFDSPVDISSSAGESGSPEVFVYKNNIYEVWMDNTSGNYDIMFTKSSDGGNTFSKPLDVSNLKGDSGYPQLAAWNNDVYVVWTQTMTGINYDIYFVKSSNNGDSFDTPINLSNNSGPSGWPKISSDGTIYVSWVDSTPGKFDVFITKSNDGGATFQDPTNLSNSVNESYENEMVVANNSVYMVWEEGQRGNYTIAFSKSTTFVPEFGPLASVALMVSIVGIITISVKSGLKFN